MTKDNHFNNKIRGYMNEFYRFLIGISIMIAVTILIVGCEVTEHTSGGEVEAIYWHEGERYTAVTENADVLEHHRIPPFAAGPGAVTLYKDAVPGEKSWYKCEWTRNNWTGADPDLSYCDIHIHSIDELGTGNWNHGKFGSGSTTRID